MSIPITTLKICHYGYEGGVFVWMRWIPKDELVPTILRYFHFRDKSACPEKVSTWNAQLEEHGVNYNALYRYCSEEQIGYFDYSHTHALTSANMEVSPTFGDPSDPVI